MNGYRGDNNDDLDKFFDISQYTAPSNGMFPTGTGFAPLGMNFSGGMATFPPTPPGYGQVQYDAQTSCFPFSEQQIDPAAIMSNDVQGSESSPANSQEQSQTSEEVYVPKPKRTRRSKKKPLSQEEAEKKREEFLERNRVAASKCRKRKQEQTHNLQENHVGLQRENFLLQENIKDLQHEITQLRAYLVGHCASGGCQKPQELGQQIDNFESMIQNDSVYGSPLVRSTGNAHSPYSAPISRSSSAMSYVSLSGCRPGYKADGVTPDLNSRFCPEHELKRLNKERLARDEEYVTGLAMSRQNSNGSSSSRTTRTSEATGKELGCTSAITTPEGASDNSSFQPTSTTSSFRRGRPHKAMKNPRGSQQETDPTLKVEGLQGMEDLASFFAQQQ